MYEPRHPLTPEAPKALPETEAYYTQEEVAAPKKPQRDLSALEQMFAYYGSDL